MKAVYLTYHVNHLQYLHPDRDVFASLNNPHGSSEISLAHDRFVTAHPYFSRGARDDSTTTTTTTDSGSSRPGRDMAFPQTAVAAGRRRPPR